MATLVVNSGGATGAPGTFSNLEDAVAAANNGDTILLSAGTIQLEGAAKDGQVFINKNLSVVGSGKTDTVVLATTSIANAENTSTAAIITVDAANTVNFSQFTLNGGDVDATGTVNGGVKTATGILYYGAGNVDSLSITNIGADVEAEPRGAGINVFFGSAGNVTITNTNFSQNERRDVGVFDGRNVFILDSTFTAKTVDDDTSPTQSVNYAVQVDGAQASITNSVFTGYSATQTRPASEGNPEIVFTSAAILEGNGSTVSITNATFTQNSTAAALGFGDPADTSVLNLAGSVTVNSTLPGALAVAAQGDVTLNGATVLAGSAPRIDFEGGAGNNVITGGIGDDRLDGNGGGDAFRGNGGNDTIDGGAGGDSAAFAGQQSEYTIAFQANGDIVVTDKVAGRDGTDTLRSIETLIFAGGPASVINGTAGDDTRFGTDGPDLIFTGAGNDTASGGLGDDNLDGGTGNDVVVGGAGNDALTGGTGDDFLGGDGGNDFISAGSGDDTVNAGDGDDFVSGDAGNDGIVAGSGADTVNAGSGDDYVDAGEGNDAVVAGTGNDFVLGGLGDDFIAGEAGDDILSGNEGNDVVRGGTGTDFLGGNEGNDILEGGDGNDVAAGGVGADFLAGDAGDDSLLGNEGDDALNGGTGNDFLVGGTGNDQFVFNANFGRDVISDFKNVAGDDDTIIFRAGTFSNFAQVVAASSQQGGDVVIQLDPNNTVTLQGVQLSTLTQNDFFFA